MNEQQKKESGFDKNRPDMKSNNNDMKFKGKRDTKRNKPVAVVKKVKFAEYEQHNTDVLPTPAELPVAESIGVLPSPPLHMYDPQEYKDLQADKPDAHN